MTKKRAQTQCYIVYEDSGEYDEFWSTPVVAFSEEAAAIAERDRRNVLADALQQKWRDLPDFPEIGLPDDEYNALFDRRVKKEAALKKRRVKALGSEEFDGVFSIREVPYHAGETDNA